jgi:hypothetical protein
VAIEECHDGGRIPRCACAEGPALGLDDHVVAILSEFAADQDCAIGVACNCHSADSSSGLRNTPGILCEDVTELVDHEPDLVILSRGREGRLGVSPETLSLLATHGVPVVLEKTDAALATTTRWQPKGAESQGSSTPPASSSVEVVGCDHIDTRLPA